MTAMLFSLPKQRVLDANAKPVSGAKVYIYDSGTTTPRTTYSNRARSIAQTHPVVADVDGWLEPMYPPDGAYKILVTDSDGVTIWTADDQAGPLDLSAFLTGAVGVVEAVSYVPTAHASNSADYGKIFVCDATGGGFDFNVPTAISQSGKQLTVINNGTANKVTVKQYAAELVDGGASIVLYPGERVTLVSDGAQLVRKSESFQTLRWSKALNLGASVDMDTMLTSGFYEVQSPTNAPATGANWYVQVEAANNAGSGYVKQVATRQDVDDGTLYYRRRLAGTFGPWLSAVSTAVEVRQTVLAGPVDSNGLPTLLPSTSGTLSLTSQNVSSSAPLVVTAANGHGRQGRIDRIGYATSNLTWSSLTSSATCYLYVDIAADGTMTTGFTTLSPAYQQGGTYSTTSGQFTFNIREMTGKAGDGSTASQVWRCYVGECVTNGSGVTSSVAYAYKGRYVSPPTPSGGVRTVFSHNIGVLPILRVDTYLVNVTGELGYSTGQYARLQMQANAGYAGGTPASIEDRNTFASVASTGTLVTHRTTGAITNITGANWKFVVVADRGW